MMNRLICSCFTVLLLVLLFEAQTRADFISIPGCPSLNDFLPKVAKNETSQMPPCFCDNATADADPPVLVNCLVSGTFQDLTQALSSVHKAGKRLHAVNVEYMTFNNTVGIPDRYFHRFNLAPAEITIVACQNELLPLNGTFLGLEKSLKKLTISACTLESMPFISNFTALESLVLQDTFISTISSGDFRGLTSLKHLDLIGNQINYVQKGAFQDLVNVESAVLGPRNSMNESALEEITRMTSMRKLVLDKNSINQLPDNAFSRLKKLQVLDLSRNNLENITNGSFIGLTNLTTLVLTQNLLKRIDDGAFRDQKRLLELSIDANYIEDIWPETFQGLESLENLTLDANDFYYLDKGLFSAMSRLKSLNFRLQKYLQYVDPDVFSGLSNLRLLNLSLSNITTIEPDLLKPIGIKLETLDLNATNIYSLDEESFHYGANIQNLSLSNTQLTSLPKGVFAYLNRLRFLDLSNNQWVCDDQLAWLVKWLKERTRKYNLTLVNSNDTVCWEPLDIRNSPLISLNPDSLRPYKPVDEFEQPPTTTTEQWTPPTTAASNDTENITESGSDSEAGNQSTTTTTTAKPPALGDPLKINPGPNEQSRKVRIIIAIVASVLSAATVVIIIIVVMVMRKTRRKRKQQQQAPKVTGQVQNGSKPSGDETEMVTRQTNDSGDQQNGSAHAGTVVQQAGSQEAKSPHGPRETDPAGTEPSTRPVDTNPA